MEFDIGVAAKNIVKRNIHDDDMLSHYLVLFAESLAGRLVHLFTVTISAVFSNEYFIVKKSLPSLGPSSFSE